MLTLEREDERTKETQRLVFTLLHANRFLYRYEVSPAGQPRFKRVYQDNAWLLFRKSGTEPLIRVYSDAPTRERAEELAAQGEALLQACL